MDSTGSELVLVDGSNVRRSGWPNASEAELVAALHQWAVETLGAGTDVLVVFDGEGDVEPTERVGVACVSYADDEIVTRARERLDQRGEVRVATSDRELRDRLEQAGAQVAWGGGRFLRELGLGRGRR